jgi:TetR/AcrR family tetracycline transcriptional repressor
MVANARSFRRAMLSVRDGARVNAGTRPSTSQFADAEKQLQLYVDAGFTVDEAFRISIAVARYVVGFVLEEQDERERDTSEPDWSGNPMEEVKAFPLLTVALQPLVHGGTINTETVFEAGLGYLLTGMRADLKGRRG